MNSSVRQNHKIYGGHEEQRHHKGGETHRARVLLKPIGERRLLPKISLLLLAAGTGLRLEPGAHLRGQRRHAGRGARLRGGRLKEAAGVEQVFVAAAGAGIASRIFGDGQLAAASGADEGDKAIHDPVGEGRAWRRSADSIIARPCRAPDAVLYFG